MLSERHASGVILRIRGQAWRNRPRFGDAWFPMFIRVNDCRAVGGVNLTFNLEWQAKRQDSNEPLGASRSWTRSRVRRVSTLGIPAADVGVVLPSSADTGSQEPLHRGSGCLSDSPGDASRRTTSTKRMHSMNAVGPSEQMGRRTDGLL